MPCGKRQTNTAKPSTSFSVELVDAEGTVHASFGKLLHVRLETEAA